MKKGLIASFISLMLFTSVKGQQLISIDSLHQHIGDSVTVCTKIYGGIFLDRSKDQPTLLNAGGRYPDAPLTILIGLEARKKFAEAPELFFKDKEVCITGKIILYKEKPEIIIYEEKQILVK
jgi:hypothetical protein